LEGDIVVVVVVGGVGANAALYPRNKNKKMETGWRSADWCESSGIKTCAKWKFIFIFICTYVATYCWF